MKKILNSHFFIQAIYVVVVLISFYLSYLFLIHQKNASIRFITGADADVYIIMSKDIALGLKNGIRTYGYPLFLKLIQYPYSQDIHSFKIFGLYILVMQYFLYASSVFLFAFAVTENKNIRALIIAGLLLQLNLLTYLSVTLTEALSISSLLFCLALFFGVKQGFPRVFFIGLLSAFSIEIRPANLWVYLLMILLLSLELIDKPTTLSNKFKSLFFFSVGSLLSFAPQIYFNFKNFHSFNPLITTNLGLSQFNWGKEMTFFSASLENKTVIVSVIKNPFMITSPTSFKWVSINGLSYGLLKIMVMFHHSSLFVYQFIRESYQQWMVFYSSFNTYFGIAGLIFQRTVIPQEKMRAILIGLFLCIALHITTALEDRFTLAICLLLMPFALYQFWLFLKNKNYLYLALFLVFFLFTNLFNHLLESLSPTYVALVQSQGIK